MAMTARSDGATPRMGTAAAGLLFTVLAAAGAATLVWLVDPALAAIDAAPTLLAPNVLPVLLLAWLLLALTRRPAFSLGVALLLLYVLYSASALKSKLLDTPVLPTDFILLGHLGDGGGLLLRYVSIPALVALFAACVCAVALGWIERPWTRLRGWRRVLLLCIVVALCTSLLAGVRPWSSVYAAAEEDFQRWSPAESALRSGLPSTLLRYSWHTDFVLPQPDRAEAARFIAAHALPPAAPPRADALPDIIVLQSESFFDAARLRGLEPEQVLPQMRRVAASARHGELWVPTFGGGTIRTEFEVLTGIAMRYFPEVQYPYFRLTATPVPSLASVLAARGYRTIAVHPNEREFWNRASALRNLGFAEFDDDEAVADAARVGWYVGDEALVDYVLARLDAAATPAFVFAISIENHGPYVDYPNADAAAIARQPAPPALDAAAAADLRGYLLHLANADRSLGRLVDALRQRPRRTLLLFYGDHLPALPDVYAGAGFDDGREGQQQTVPWLLFDSAHAQGAPAEATAAFYLPALLLAQAGIDDPYFDMIEAARRDDRPELDWVPADEDALRALMRMRQLGEGLPAAP